MLIRSAHSSNIKERRDASTALFDADGQMVMQAEHIPVHLGAMPAAVAAVLGERHAPGRLVDPQRPVRRRHAPARHHRHHARVRTAERRRAASASPPAARTTPTSAGACPGSMPADSRTLDEEGVVIAPRPLGRARRSRSSSRGCASRDERRADLRAQLAANRVGAQRLRELAERLGAERLREAHRRGARLLRAAHARVPGGAPRRRAPRARTCSRRARAISSCACARCVDGERLLLDFAGSAAAARRQPQLPARGHALGVPVRGARAHRPRHPADRRRLPPDRGARAARARCSTRAPARRSRPATSRPPRASPTSCSSAFGRAQGQGTMNNLTLGQTMRLLLLRDARRRPGRVRGRGRPERRARGDEQHAEHADRGARARVPAAGASSTRCAAAPAARAPSRRRRRRARARSAARDDLLADRRAPPPRARAAPTAAAPARAGATCSTGGRCPARSPARCAPASGCASKRPAEEDSEMPEQQTH